ncbi:type II secretion system GspH family protein [Mariniblastus sp.]|nr:type II secretion system GspH family protein [Mariniblastus sp.]
MKKSFKRNSGITLVELLVVISILAVITAVMLPRLRTINKDRNIRESARVVGSLLAKASQNAVNDGTAGVIVERNENFVDDEGVMYGATTMYLMRKVPVFTGDFATGDPKGQATPLADYTLDIYPPFESDAVLVNDYISVNFNSVKYRIIGIAPSDTDLDGTALVTLTLSPGMGGAVLPALPPAGSSVPFVVHRQPRKLASSRVDLPNGFLVDLRYSGPINENANTAGSLVEPSRSWFDEIILPPNPNLNPVAQLNMGYASRTVQIIFNSNGGVDRVYYYNPYLDVNYVDEFENPADFPDADKFGSGFIDSRIPNGPLFFYVSEYEIESLPNNGVLDSPANLWVTLNNSTGATNVASSTVPTDPNANLGARIEYARGIAKEFQSATQ